MIFIKHNQRKKEEANYFKKGNHIKRRRWNRVYRKIESKSNVIELNKIMKKKREMIRDRIFFLYNQE